MWARALGGAAGWKYFLREFGPLHTLVRPQPLCGTWCCYCWCWLAPFFHSLSSFASLPFLSVLSFPSIASVSCPFLLSVPCPSLLFIPGIPFSAFPSLTCPSFPPLPSSSFISFQFSPSFPACFPAFPFRYFRVFPFLLSHHHVHYYQREHTRWGTVRGTVYAPLCRQYVFGLQVLAPSSPIYPPNLILKKGFRSEAP